MFGQAEMNIYYLLAGALILIGVLILLVVYLIVAARVRTKKIAKARIKYFERLQADYVTLESQLAKWTKEKSKKGFDPYSGVSFNNF